MWNQNADSKEWLRVEDTLSKESFDFLRQEIADTRLYQVCLSGASFMVANDPSNLYGVLLFTQSGSWVVSSPGSPYSDTYEVESAIQITSDTLPEWHRYLAEHGFSLRTKFTPVKTIRDALSNYKEVDAATTGPIQNIGQPSPGLVVDGYPLKVGNLLLVKDQTELVGLSNSVDPYSYFTGSFAVGVVGSSSTTYSVYTAENGVYVYDSDYALSRATGPTGYAGAYGLSTHVRSGRTNYQSEYHLDRLPTGYFPEWEAGDRASFSRKRNWLIRHRVDYNNIYELVYNDIRKHGPQTFSVGGYTYSIPERTLAVGEFGTLFLNQSGKSTIMPNKFKETLNCLAENTANYWACGNRGHLLKISKIDFSVAKVDLGEVHDLRSISWVDDIRAIIVGRFNTMYETVDGGKTWTDISVPEFDDLSYTKVLYLRGDKAFVGGEAGAFIEMDRVQGRWVLYKRMVVKDLDTTEPTEDYLLVDDIRDLRFATYSGSTWPLNYSFTTQSSVADHKEVLIIAGNNNTLAVKDLNGFDGLYEFKFLGFTQTGIDISSVAPIVGSSSLYVAADKVYKVSMDTFGQLGSQSNLVSSFATPSVVHDVFANRIDSFGTQSVLLCGNESTLKYIGLTGLTESVADIDGTFFNRHKSRMLFLNYDIASKLNFFDDTQTYRLPDSLGLTAGEIGDLFYVSNKDGELNWLSYYKDFEKTFEYYTSFDEANKVLFSTEFTYSPTTYFPVSPSQVTNALADILPLAPNIGTQSSPMVVAGDESISTPSADKDIFVYRNLLVIRRTSSYSVDVGDVMYISSDVLKARLVVNKIGDLGGYKFMYCFHNIEQGAINDLMAYDDDIHVVNLNKYSTVGEIETKEIIYNTPYDYPWNYNNEILPEDYFAYEPLANPDLFGDLLFNFNMHPVSYGYRLLQSPVDKYDLTLETKFNNRTAYYNMQTRVETEFLLENMNYRDAFLSFGYKPHYNLTDYLGNVDPVTFTSSKVFYAMPEYSGIPANDGDDFTDSVIYFDTNPLASPAWPKNKLLFGRDLHFEWSTVHKNTFVDVELVGSGAPSERMFVMDKYYDDSLGGYVIEFHRELDYEPYTNVSSVNISSRRTLGQISDDLMMLNNIHRSSLVRQLSVPIYPDDEFTSLQNELNFKFSTEAYAKVLLSDKDIRQSVTAMIYTDAENELCMDVLNLERSVTRTITGTSAQSVESVNRLKVTTLEPHGLIVGDVVNLVFTGAGISSAQYNRSYFGTQFVIQVIDESNFVTDREHGVSIVGEDPGVVYFSSRDPYFNFEPVDLMGVGTDSVQKRAVLVRPENVKLDGYTYSLVNVDYSKYRYELVDGMTLTRFYARYPWALEGNISDALIGEDENGMVWYRGDWECGRWFGGTWMSGRWLSGDWYAGTWNSFKVGGSRLLPTVGTTVVTNTDSVWYGGRWFGGTWNGGTWHNGRMYSVEWLGGVWNNGIWNDGSWRGGSFRGGIWVSGTWDSGFFSSRSRPAYWIGGVWKGGDFENGVWYDGDFSSDLGTSRFGTGAFNTRTAIWHGGRFRNSEFHSYLNRDVDGTPIQSEYYKYSQWNAGVFTGGNWYGGVAYAINFNSGNWYGGVVEDIQVIGLDVFTQSQSASSWQTKIVLNGVFYINVNDELWVINDDPTPFDFFGSRDNPRKYYAMLVTQIGDTTEVVLDRDLHTDVELVQESSGMMVTGATSASNTDTGLRVVANFRDSNWKSGVWTTGIFESGFFEGGIWYGGRFGANWGR